jgi:hypothetical protein
LHNVDARFEQVNLDINLDIKSTCLLDKYLFTKFVEASAWKPPRVHKVRGSFHVHCFGFEQHECQKYLKSLYAHVDGSFANGYASLSILHVFEGEHLIVLDNRWMRMRAYCS